MEDLSKNTTQQDTESLHNEYWYLDKAEAYEKEYQFDKAVDYLKLYFAELYKDYNLVFDKRGSKKHGVKFLIYRCRSGSADFYYQYLRLSSFYLKMGTNFLKEYWISLRNSPYYEENSYFKNMVEDGILTAEQKQAEGYIYKPATNANREKFLAYAKEKGWR